MPEPLLTNQQMADAMFLFLRDVLYAPERAKLDTTGFAPEFETLAEGLKYLGQCADEQARYAHKLTQGNLEAKAPDVENGLAAPLKSIQGMLLHLSWQVQEVAKGDYGQTIDFMGELGDAVNTMTKQLAERENQLVLKNQSLEKANEDLSSLHELMMMLALGSTRYIVFVDEETHAMVFSTDAAEQYRSEHPQTVAMMISELEKSADVPSDQLIVHRTLEFHPFAEEGLAPMVRYDIQSTHVVWNGRSTIAHIITDSTKDLEMETEMKQLAFHDPLTGLTNRRRSMQIADGLYEANVPFGFCFVDLDNLKYCNDDFGHSEGDVYITSVANILKEGFPDGVVARIGGDEFLVIDQDHDKETLEAHLAELRKKVIALPVPQGYAYHRSFSYGVCQVPAEHTMELSEYLSEADAAMYKFKFSHKKELRI